MRLATPWVAGGTVAVAAATGLGAQMRVLDTSGVRWVHHALYGAALAACVVATLVQGVLGERRRAAMAPTVVVLAALARTRGRTGRHATLGAVAVATAGVGAIRAR